jgi:hypothetical protein
VTSLGLLGISEDDIRESSSESESAEGDGTTGGVNGGVRAMVVSATVVLWRPFRRRLPR